MCYSYNIYNSFSERRQCFTGICILSLTGNTVHPKNVTSTIKKRAAQSSGRKGKANPAAVTLANFFKMKAKADDLRFGGLTPSEKPDSTKSAGCDQTVPQSKKTATSLILFEEVNNLAHRLRRTYIQITHVAWVHLFSAST